LPTIELVPLEHLDPAPYNPRKISDQQLDALARSMREFGVVDPVIANRDGTVIGGHQRIKAAERLGLSELPVIYVDLPKEKEKALNLALNRISGEWDEDLLDALLRDLEILDVDLSLTGFTEEELAGILGHAAADDYPEDPGADLDRAEELQAKWGTEPGQLWEVGRHLLLCGDATNAGDVERLLAGVRPHLMVTDPPYGVEYDPAWRARTGVNLNPGKLGKVTNDDRADWREAWALFPGEVAYVWHAGSHAGEVQESLRAAGFEVRAQIVWAKDRFALSRGDYHWQHEPCWYAVRKGKKGHWAGDRKQSTLWEIPARDDDGYGHGTQKPVDCMRRPILNNSSEGQAIYDPFLGSGTTMVACEQTGRVCYGMEIEPKYVAVALERMAGMGLDPRREEHSPTGQEP
jgi:DNA modification methylase